MQVLGDEVDALSAVYMTCVLDRGGTISYKALSKDLRQRGVDVSGLVHKALLEQDGNNISVRGPASRTDDIESKQSLLTVDRAHYLRYLYETEQLTSQFGQWADESAVVFLRQFAEIEHVDDYAEYR